jgi:kynurenine formamidase
MKLVDLTLPTPPRENNHPLVVTDEWLLSAKEMSYTGMVYHFNHWSMSGTYIDFPGHIKELDDGMDASNYPLEKLCEVESVLLRLDRDPYSGKIHAEELESACGVKGKIGGVIVHALGDKRFDEIPGCTVSFAADAIAWMVNKGVHLLVSDVYENSNEPENVFWHLFSAGISTVCVPDNLNQLHGKTVNLTVLFPRFPKVTQLPCRLIAKMDD